MGVLLQLSLIAAAIWFLWKVISTMGKFKKEPEPPGHSKIPAKLRRGPRDRSGAVAIAEPEDEGCDPTSADNVRLL